jgi:hypothetical protein
VPPQRGWSWVRCWRRHTATGEACRWLNLLVEVWWAGVAEGVFSLDIAVAAPGIGAVDYAAEGALASHEAHAPTLQGLDGAKPWGQDAIGKAFEESYQQILPQTLVTWSKIVWDLADFAANLKLAQDEAWAANQAATRIMSVE